MTWDRQEEKKIFELQKQLGNKWSEIATHMPGRTDNSIKNCFYSAIRRNLRKYNKRKNESEKLKGSLKSLLKKPATRAILMKLVEDSNPIAQPVVEPKIEHTVQKPQKNTKKLSSSSRKNIDIICPVISPLPTMTMFQFPMTPLNPLTPSTTPGILSTRFGSNCFNFSEEYSMIENFHSAIETEGNMEGLNSEQSTPKYFIPYFSPKNTFQHYFTPRNSNSK